MKKCCTFLTGMLVGVIAATLVTPKTGKEMQTYLINKTNHLQNKLNEFDVTETRDLLIEKVKEIHTQILDFDWSDSKEIVANAVEEITVRIKEIKQEIMDEIAQAKEELENQ